MKRVLEHSARHSDATRQLDNWQVQARAYEMYEQRGRADGHDLEDWLTAERDITGERAPPAGPSNPAGTSAHLFAVAQDDPGGEPLVTRFYDALKAAGYKPELHVFSAGGHGFGMRKQDKPNQPIEDEPTRVREDPEKMLARS